MDRDWVHAELAYDEPRYQLEADEALVIKSLPWSNIEDWHGLVLNVTDDVGHPEAVWKDELGYRCQKELVAVEGVVGEK